MGAHRPYHVMPSAEFFLMATLSSGLPILRSTGKTMGRARSQPGAQRPRGSGCRVTHLLALLPEEPRERVETPGDKPSRRNAGAKMGPKDWLAWARKTYPQRRNERPTPYIRRLHGLMEKTDNVTEVWRFETFRVRYYEAVKADQRTVQKTRKLPRSV